MLLWKVLLLSKFLEEILHTLDFFSYYCFRSFIFFAFSWQYFFYFFIFHLFSFCAFSIVYALIISMNVYIDLIIYLRNNLFGSGYIINVRVEKVIFLNDFYALLLIWIRTHIYNILSVAPSDLQRFVVLYINILRIFNQILYSVYGGIVLILFFMLMGYFLSINIHQTYSPFCHMYISSTEPKYLTF